MFGQVSFNRTVVISGLIFLCGCAQSPINPEYSFLGGGRVTSAGVNQLTAENFETFSDEQLISLLTAGKNNTKSVDEAFYFANTDGKKDRRNQVQDRLIAASNNRCNLYLNYLRRVDTYQNFLLGSLSTIFGGAGAIVTGVEAARLLAGLAGISSGIRAEARQAFLSNLASSVIVPAIRLKRERYLTDKLEPKKSRSIEEYTVQLAVADAIEYHGFCTIDEGIKEAGVALQRSDDPGLDSLDRAFKKLGVARGSLKALVLPPAISGTGELVIFAEDERLAAIVKINEGEGKITSIVADEEKRVKAVHADLVKSRDAETDEAKKKVLEEKVKALDGQLSKLTGIVASVGPSFQAIAKGPKEEIEKLKDRAQGLDNKWAELQKGIVKAAQSAQVRDDIGFSRQQLDVKEFVLTVRAILLPFESAMEALEKKVKQDAHDAVKA